MNDNDTGPYADLTTRLYEVNGLFTIQDSPQLDGTYLVTVRAEDGNEDGVSVEFERGDFDDLQAAEAWGWRAHTLAEQLAEGALAGELNDASAGDAQGALKKIADIIERVEHRCMAADGPVAKTLDVMQESEMQAIWDLTAIVRR